MKILELRQNPNLICSDFDGYKLSLDQIPIFRQGVMCSPFKAESNEEQYSFLHYKMFSWQNLLVVDPWARSQSYFFNCLGEVVRCAYDENRGAPHQQHVVYRLRNETGEHGRKPGDYNFSFRFLSENLCLVCDGGKSLSLFDTGDRLKAIEWTLVARCQIEGGGFADDERGYIIFDSRLDIIEGRKEISLILGHIQRVEYILSNHFLYLHWTKWILEDSVWKLQLLDTLEGKGWVYYCAFEPRSESVVISSNHDFKWLSRTSKSSYHQRQHRDEKNPQFHGENFVENEYLGISWLQTDVDLILKFEIIPGKDESDYNVITRSNSIQVKCNKKVLLDGELFKPIVEDLTTWTIESTFLQITLVKSTSGFLWTSLLANGVGPKETNGENLKSSLLFEHHPIANLESPIEDCDFPMDTAADDSISISRFNISARTVTHSIMMSSTPPLFSTSLRPGFPHALASREDIDCCLWLQQYNPSKPHEWSFRHEGTLPAFGYVQASKQQKKFVDCSPDLGYAVIAEIQRHVFLYKTKYDTAIGLRNRNGSKIAIGKQHLIALDDDGEVLGLTTANNVLTLLTEKTLYFFQVGS